MRISVHVGRWREAPSPEELRSVGSRARVGLSWHTHLHNTLQLWGPQHPEASPSHPLLLPALSPGAQDHFSLLLQFRAVEFVFLDFLSVPMVTTSFPSSLQGPQLSCPRDSNNEDAVVHLRSAVTLHGLAGAGS